MDIEEVMDTAKWIDPPETGAYERFFIMDKETREWFKGLSRNSFAKFVSGEKPLSRWNKKYEPFRDEIHHLVVYNDGKSFSYDCKEYLDGSWQ